MRNKQVRVLWVFVPSMVHQPAEPPHGHFDQPHSDPLGAVARHLGQHGQVAAAPASRRKIVGSEFSQVVRRQLAGFTPQLGDQSRKIVVSLRSYLSF